MTQQTVNGTTPSSLLHGFYCFISQVDDSLKISFTEIRLHVFISHSAQMRWPSGRFKIQ